MVWNISMPDAEWVTREHPDLESIIREVADKKVVAIDTETTGLDNVRCRVLYWSLSWESQPGFFRRLCLRSDTLGAFRQARIFDDPSREWCFANAKFDLHMLFNTGIDVKGTICDTQVMHALLYEEESHRLEHMARQVLGWQWKDDFKTGFKKEGPEAFLTRLEREDRDRLVEYASNDAYGTLFLRNKLKQELEEAATWSLYPELYSTLHDIFYKIEAPFTRVLWKCERNGFYVDRNYLQSINGPVSEELTRIEREIWRQVGWAINLNSPPQLRKYFFEEKKYKPFKMTKGGRSGVKEASTDADTLEFLATELGDPVADLMLKYRELDKLKGTYVEGIQEALDPWGRVHTHFNQDVARTGRLSSSDINLQNIPRPDTDKFRIRKAFIPEKGNNLIVADYEALEMRLLAAAAMEQDMIDIFKQGKDIHMGNASLVFNIPYEELAKAKKTDKDVKAGKLPESAMTDHYKFCLQKRQEVKTIGFGLNYGMKEAKLARDLGITKEEALALMDRYMARYPAVKHFYDEAINTVRKTGYAFTLLGRRRFLPEILAARNDLRWRAERQASNVPIQGTAADVVKMAMIQCDQANILDDFGYHMLIQVHDELAFEGPEETTEPCQARIQEIMEDSLPSKLAVDLKVSIAHGKSWMDCH